MYFYKAYNIKSIITTGIFIKFYMNGEMGMLNLKTDFDKLMIDTGYVFDVSFCVGENDHVELNDGTTYKLNNIIAVQRKEDEDVEIIFNVEIVAGVEYEQKNIAEFKNCEAMKSQIIKHLNKHIEQIKYTDSDK